jgi:DNA-binding MarR family transcriptional regulator
MDKEARLTGTTAAEHPEELRLWLRMLTCTQLIETRVRGLLREQFETTLPRFDLLSQLDRAPEGLKMNELSRRLMVTGGNITGTTDQLVSDGLVERVPVPTDRRAFRIKLTPKGRKLFDAMAIQHESWIVEAFGTLDKSEIASLYQLLNKVKAQSLSIKKQVLNQVPPL